MHSQFEPEPVHEAAHPLLEKYLDRLCDPLKHDAPAEEAELARQEMRAHLLLSAAAREELGATPEEALAEAFRRFGDPQLLGQKLARENTTVRTGRRLSLEVRILGSLLGGGTVLYLTPFLSSLIQMSTGVSSFILPQYVILLVLLGGHAGWHLASNKRSSAGGPLAGLAGSVVGMAANVALALFAYHHGWLAGVTYPLDMGNLCLNAGLGAAVGWLLWKRPKPLLKSIFLGSAVCGLPLLLNAIRTVTIYPDYRNVHIVSLYAIGIGIWSAAGAITGAASWLFARIKPFWERKEVLTAEKA